MKRMIVLPLAGLALTLLTGCAPKAMDPETLAAMMKPPARPIELDRLNAFVGSWTTTAEFKGEDGEITKGSHTSSWDADRWVLVEHWDHEMGPGNRMKGVQLKWWDMHARRYRTTWTSNYGEYSRGIATYDKETDTWHMQTENWDATGKKTRAKHTMKFTDARTMKWTWAESDALGLMTFMEMSGTSRRQ